MGRNYRGRPKLVLVLWWGNLALCLSPSVLPLPGAVSPGVVTRTSCSGGPRYPDREVSDQEGSEFLVFQPGVDPVTSSAPATSGPDASQEIQTTGARRYPTRNRPPPERCQAGV
ncbi:hypothetical protein MTO96_039142 [Rhipicephalus appendiculatus]